RAQRMADVFEGRVADPMMQGAPTMAHLTLAVALDVAAKPRFRRSHHRPAATGRLDGPHFGAALNATDEPTAIASKKTLGRFNGPAVETRRPDLSGPAA